MLLTCLNKEVIDCQHNRIVFKDDMSCYLLLGTILYVLTTINFTHDPYLQAPGIIPLQLMILSHDDGSLNNAIRDHNLIVLDLLSVHVWFSHVEVTDLR